MGLSPFSSSTFDTPQAQGNPNPWHYKINAFAAVNGNLVLDITYPNCTNYEGRKILVFHKLSINELRDQRAIDPHFSENKARHSPFARFEPTEKGWDLAIKFAKELA